MKARAENGHGARGRENRCGDRTDWDRTGMGMGQDGDGDGGGDGT